MRTPLGATAILAVVALTILSGCARGGTSAISIAAAQADPSTPQPIASASATCIADYPQYTSASDLVSRADLIVRVTATGPSRDYDAYPLPHSSEGSGLQPQPPQEGLTAQEQQERDLTALPATAITVRVEEVLKGEVTVGDVFEVNQNPCTARPLPTGGDLQYLLALESYQLPPGTPRNQLNDSQAAWQVGQDRSLVPVNPDNDLGITSVDQLLAVAR
ncbi:hypothetical protein [Quadrisphaera sp. KR29]|uniref:hypothetical protein n=1 Tax=Quadrisphaera sp. KR29 TaxID=3461391 RepID=UPI004043C68A